MKRSSICSIVAYLLCAGLARGEGAASTQPASGPEQVQAEELPITEVTVFKDGHAFVLREGTVAMGQQGTVVLDDLPAPVLGTFWPYSADKGVVLRQVIAGKREVRSPEPALSIRDLLAANVGAIVQVCEADGRDYDATIVAIPEPKPAPDRTQPSPSTRGGSETSRPFERGNIVLLQVHDETRAVPIDRIRNLVFRGKPKQEVGKPESRGMLTLHLASLKAAPVDRARIGMIYLQKGLRWIPNYKVEIDGNGSAIVKLQATLINELANLRNANVQLVVGVPSFAFKDNLDPMALQETAAQLGPHFQPSSQTAFAFSNAIMSQSAAYEAPASPPSGPSLGPDVPAGTKTEDLFIFSIGNITLAKGERMVIPVAEYTLAYKDVYVLELPGLPPAELARSLGYSQSNLQNARLMLEPKVMHKLRFTNNTKHPFTTAPALIVQKDRALGQGMMTYTAVGGTSDLDLTVAVDVRAKKSEVETERVPNALQIPNTNLTKVSLKGTITITNTRSDGIELEVVRNVLGQVDSAGQDGKTEQVNVYDDMDGDILPSWFWNYSWPWWWQRANGIGRIRWDVHLNAGEKKELTYTWHYFWG